MTRRRLFDYSSVPRRERTLILAAMLFWSVLIVVLSQRFVFQLPVIVGPSMLPTFHEGQRRVLWLSTYRLRAPRRSDIVAIHMPDGASTVKRVIGLPLEHVRIHDGAVYINGQRLAEPYLPPNLATPPRFLPARGITLPEDSYFVLGDNRRASEDSRHFGPVPRPWIRGTVW